MTKTTTVEETGSGTGKLNLIAFALVIAIPIVANLAFGAASSAAFAGIVILAVFLCVFWFLDSIVSGVLRAGTEPLALVVVILMLLGLIQLIPMGATDVPSGVVTGGTASSISLDPNGTRLAVYKLFVFAIFLSAAYAFIDRLKRVTTTVLVVIVFGAAMAFFAVLQYLSDPTVIYGLTPAAQAKPFGSYINQHHFASFLIMCISPALGLVFVRGVAKDKLILLLITVVLIGAGILFTGSRGAFISLIAVLAFLIIARLTFAGRREASSGTKAKRGGLLRAAAGPVLLTVGLIAVMMFVVLWAGGEDGLSRGAAMQVAGADFTTGRARFWSVALQIFRDHPFLGAGLESFGVAFTKYDSMNGLYRVEQAHNEYLQMLADGGVVGFLIVVSFIVLLFKRSLALISRTEDRFRRSVAVGALAGCFGVIVHSFVDFPLRTNANMFFFLLLAVLATAEIRGQQGSRVKGEG